MDVGKFAPHRLGLRVRVSKVGPVLLGLRLGLAHFSLGELGQSYALLQKSKELNPDEADAWYALGCAAGEAGDEALQREGWRRAWKLDSAPHDHGDGDHAHHHLDDETVTSAAEEALGELPDRARALLRDVPIIVADLPAEADVDTGLDPRAIRTLKHSIAAQAQAGKAIIISSHLLDLVEDLCSHLLILDRGERRFFGPLADVRCAFASLREDESLEEIFFRATEGPAVAPNGTNADEPAPVERVP